MKAAAEAAKERGTEKSNCKGSFGSHAPARKATARLGLSGAGTPAKLLGAAIHAYSKHTKHNRKEAGKSHLADCGVYEVPDTTELEAEQRGATMRSRCAINKAERVGDL